jgi:hypothetical protein
MRPARLASKASLGRSPASSKAGHHGQLRCPWVHGDRDDAGIAGDKVEAIHGEPRLASPYPKLLQASSRTSWGDDAAKVTRYDRDSGPRGYRVENGDPGNNP